MWSFNIFAKGMLLSSERWVMTWLYTTSIQTNKRSSFPITENKENQNSPTCTMYANIESKRDFFGFSNRMTCIVSDVVDNDESAFWMNLLCSEFSSIFQWLYETRLGLVLLHQSQETTEGVRVLTLMVVFNGSERLPISTVIHRGQLILDIIFMGITDKQVETSSFLVHISTEPDRGW